MSSGVRDVLKEELSLIGPGVVGHGAELNLSGFSPLQSSPHLFQRISKGDQRDQAWAHSQTTAVKATGTQSQQSAITAGRKAQVARRRAQGAGGAGAQGAGRRAQGAGLLRVGAELRERSASQRRAQGQYRAQYQQSGKPERSTE